MEIVIRQAFNENEQVVNGNLQRLHPVRQSQETTAQRLRIETGGEWRGNTL